MKGFSHKYSCTVCLRPVRGYHKRKYCSIACRNACPAWRQGTGNGRRGKHRTPEQIRALAEFNRGKPAWNRGAKMPPRPPMSAEQKQKLRIANLGKTPSLETRRKLSERFKGSRSVHWRGGLTKESARIRNSLEYTYWREQVFKRDNYTCQACGIRGGFLHADHELPFAFFPDLRFEVLNGRALCVPCHKKTPTYKYGAVRMYGN